MDSLNDIEIEDVANDLGFLLDESAAHIIRTQNPESFISWFQTNAPVIAPNFIETLPDDEQALRGFLYNMARVIWNKTPLPDNRFRPSTLHKPERNLPCPCGSNRKYKHCCLAAESFEKEMGDFSMLLHVLNQTPHKQFAELPFTYLDLDELAYVARTWMDQGKTKDAVKLLEGLFAHIEKLDARAEYAFDLLLDGYSHLGNTVKKNSLLEKGLQAPDKYLRAAAMQRLCCIHSDKGDYPRAWALFQEIQRLIPNDSSLAHLEIVLLHGQGEHERAAERAKFWIARLSRDNNPQNAELIEFLKQSTTDLGGAMLDIVQNNIPELGQMSRLIDAMPAPKCLYQLNGQDGSAGPLKPDAQLQRLHIEWRELFSVFTADYIGVDWPSSRPWLNWLEKNPLAWQSIEVVGELFLALDEGMQPFPGFAEKILLPLMLHGNVLLRLILKQNHAEGLRLEWSYMENRDALRMVSALGRYYEAHDNLKESINLVEWLVLTLNPNDNQGMRENLLHHYLRQGRLDAAVGLAAHYPRDMASMQYGHTLALLMAGRENEAAVTLKQARQDYPEIYKMLISPKPRRPKLTEGRVTVGGKDEAWYYREDYLDIWQQSGGLEWLRNAKPTKGGNTALRKQQTGQAAKDATAGDDKMPASTTPQQMLQLRITLLNVKPPVRRRVLVSANLTFLQLHHVIQAAMGWEDCHMHEFEVGRERIGTSSKEDSFFGGETALPEGKHRLGETLASHKKFRYWYDFGDDWWHEITIEKRFDAKPDDPPVRLLDGENACPPEDCGGPWGYAELCAALSDPTHLEHAEMLEWVGGEFDPKVFDMETCAKQVSRCVRTPATKKVR
jgi:tetratricopeptide (TPR) repeat protein